MSLYQFALFLHLVGVGLLFTALAAETVGLGVLRRAEALSGLRLWSGAASLTRTAGPAAAVLIVVPGIYMSSTTVGWPAWIVLGLAGMVAIALVGATNGIALSRRVAAATRDEAISSQSLAGVTGRRFVISLATRYCLATGVVFLMTTKPNWAESAITMSAAALVGPLAIGTLHLAGRGARTAAAVERAAR